jgi:hypothetical protein
LPSGCTNFDGMVTPYPPYFEVDQGYPPKSLLRKCFHGPHGVGDS